MLHLVIRVTDPGSQQFLPLLKARTMTEPSELAGGEDTGIREDPGTVCPGPLLRHPWHHDFELKTVYTLI